MEGTDQHWAHGAQPTGRQADQSTRRLIESVADVAMFALDPSGVIVSWNLGAERISGHGAAEVIGRHYSMLQPDADVTAGQPQAILDAAFAKGRHHFEFERVRKDGRLVWVNVTIDAIHDEAGGHLGFAITARDVTERRHRDPASSSNVVKWRERREEAALRLLSEKNFSDTMIESMPGMLYFYDNNGRFLRWNKAFETLSGYSPDEIATMKPLDFFRDEDKPLLRERIAEVFEKGESSVEAPFRSKSGATTPCFFTGRRVRYDGADCLVGVGIDISDRKRAEFRLAESERKYRELVENANSIILRWNSDGQITFLNEFGLQFFGYAPEEILGRHVIGTIVPERESGGRDLERLIASIGAAPEDFEKNVNENVRRDGERVWIAWTNRVSRDDRGAPVEILSVGTDITERRRAEEARRKSEARYRKLFDSAPVGIVLADSSGYYLDANACLCAMLGYSRDEIVGMHSIDVVAPSEKKRIGEVMRQILGAHDHQSEWKFQRKDRVIVDTEVHATQLPDGNVLGVIRDISERRQAEAERLRRLRAEAADRVKSAFLATMSHELRTPLNSIIGFTGILLQGLAGPLNAEQNKQLDMVRVSARHLLALVNDVLDISKIEAGQLEVARAPFDIGTSINKVVALVAPQAKAKGLALRVDAPANLGQALSDERRFEQILLNLLSNAIKFTDRGEVALEARIIPDFQSASASTPQPAVRMRVTDTGVGIKADDLPTLFQPFRQIDSGISRRHEGTGLGLAICRRLTSLMGGEIHAKSRWGVGSAFTATIPLRGPAK